VTSLTEPATPNEASGDGKVLANVRMHQLGLMVGEPVEEELVESTSDALTSSPRRHLDIRVPDMGIRNVDQPVPPEMADHLPSGLGNV